VTEPVTTTVSAGPGVSADSPPGSLRQLVETARRELVLERRAGEVWGIVIPFGALALILLPLALGPDVPLLARVGPAVFWVVALLFGMLIALRQSSADPAELRDLQRLLEVDPAARLVGKALAGAVWLLGLLLVLGAATVVLYAPAIPVRWWMVPVVLMLVALGVALAATLAGEVAAGLRSRSTLAPLLAAPLGIPVLVAAAETTDRLQVGGSILTPTLLLVLVDLILAIVIVLAAGPLEDATS
jgi:heme exporter protein B